MDDAQLQHFEEELLAAVDLVPFLTALPHDFSINIVGHGSSVLRTKIANSYPPARIRAIDLVTSGSPVETGPGVWRTGLESLDDALLPRSRTLILDPVVGSCLLQRPELLERIALKTFEWVLLPVFVSPEDFRLFFSEEFSFEEPLFDDTGTQQWCHCTSSRPARVFLHVPNHGIDRRVSFRLTAFNPGTFACRVGGDRQTFTATTENPTGDFAFNVGTTPTLISAEITYTGTPFRSDNPLEQRPALYFTFSAAQVEWSTFSKVQAVRGRVLPPDGCEFQTDRAIRRRLHENGFFEVLSFAPAWLPLVSLEGVRSCFDYRGGFAFRDLWPAPFTAPPPRPYAPPSLWYQARRTPSPGSEWEEPVIRLERFAASHRRSE